MKDGANLFVQICRDYIFKEDHKVLLYPDMTRDQHEAGEFCYAAPCSVTEWTKLRNNANDNWQKDSEYLPYTFAKDEDEDICLIPREDFETDEQCVITAAYIRMVDGFTGMIYAIPKASNHALEGSTSASIISRTSGVPPTQVRHIEVKSNVSK